MTRIWLRIVDAGRRRFADDATLRRRLGLLLLAAACFVPRAAMAWRRDVLCTDAVFYIEKAEALRTGDFAAGLSELQLNLYPLTLAGLRQVTGDYETTGRWLSVMCATVTVIPLVLLVRQWGGDRIGWIAGALYACHPESIEWSPEIIRDPFFWLLTWTTLWCGWQAARTGCLCWFAASGLLLAGSILVRFEGWLLVVPLAWWWVVAARAGLAWRRLPARVTLAVAMCPALLAAVNLVPLAGHDRWEWGRFEHFATAAHWLGRQISPPAAVVSRGHGGSSNVVATHEPPVADLSHRLSLRAMRWGFRHTLFRGWHPAWLSLAGCGLLAAIARRPAMARGSNAHHDPGPNWAPVLIVSGLLLASVWVYLWKYQEINKRYFLLPMYCWLPQSALGLEASVQWLAGNAVSRFVRAVGITVWLVVLAVAGVADALASRYDGRHFKAHVGRELADEFGPGLNLLLSEDVERLIGYYARAKHRKLPDNVVGLEAVEWLEHWRPDALVLWLPNGPETTSAYGPLLARAGAEGWQRRQIDDGVDLAHDNPNRLILLVRPDVALAAAERRAAAARQVAAKPSRAAVK